jgi:hypothetical protein
MRQCYDSAGEAQQQLKTTGPSPRQEGRPVSRNTAVPVLKLGLGHHTRAGLQDRLAV